MTTDTTHRDFDASGFNYSGTKAFDIRRSAEIARAEFIGKKFRAIGKRLSDLGPSSAEPFQFAQRQKQAAWL